jgi:hypothetical protein
VLAVSLFPTEGTSLADVRREAWRVLVNAEDDGRRSVHVSTTALRLILNNLDDSCEVTSALLAQFYKHHPEGKRIADGIKNNRKQLMIQVNAVGRQHFAGTLAAMDAEDFLNRFASEVGTRTVRDELGGIAGWLSDAVRADPADLNICFNKFQLIELLDRITLLLRGAESVTIASGDNEPS